MTIARARAHRTVIKRGEMVEVSKAIATARADIISALARSSYPFATDFTDTAAGGRLFSVSRGANGILDPRRERP
jgi:hypothetical protein